MVTNGAGSGCCCCHRRCSSVAVLNVSGALYTFRAPESAARLYIYTSLVRLLSWSFLRSVLLLLLLYLIVRLLLFLLLCSRVVVVAPPRGGGVVVAEEQQRTTTPATYPLPFSSPSPGAHSSPAVPLARSSTCALSFLCARAPLRRICVGV